jgi:hypothetical protein
VRTLLRPKFPANREKYREFGIQSTLRYALTGTYRLILAPLALVVPLKGGPTNRELNQRYQGIQFLLQGNIGTKKRRHQKVPTINLSKHCPMMSGHPIITTLEWRASNRFGGQFGVARLAGAHGNQSTGELS